MSKCIKCGTGSKPNVKFYLYICHECKYYGKCERCGMEPIPNSHIYLYNCDECKMLLCTRCDRSTDDNAGNYLGINIPSKDEGDTICLTICSKCCLTDNWKKCDFSKKLDEWFPDRLSI